MAAAGRHGAPLRDEAPRRGQGAPPGDEERRRALPVSERAAVTGVG